MHTFCLAVVLALAQGVAADYCHELFPHARNYTTLKGPELIYVQLVARHGDRTANSKQDLDKEMDCHDPFRGSAFQACTQKHQLTTKGYEQHQQLGQALATLYYGPTSVHRLISTQDPLKQVLFRSTSTQRTTESIKALAYGFFNSKTITIRPEVRPKKTDSLKGDEKGCPRVKKLYMEEAKTPQGSAYLKKAGIFGKEMEKVFGKRKGVTILRYMDPFFVKHCHDMHIDMHETSMDEQDALEQGTKLLDVETQWTYRDLPQADEINRLNYGALLQELADELEHAAHDGTHGMHMYMAHDHTITGIMGGIDSEDMDWPGYAANVLIELYSTGRGKFGVRMLYRGRPLLTKDWNFNNLVPLEAFIAKLRSRRPPSDRKQACNK